jgi:hypothetical protein
MTTPRWLLLVYQLPARSSNARVKTWRRLQQVGALATRNAVYVLPNTDACHEDFEWLRTEILAAGGEATVFTADATSEGSAEELVKLFQRTRESDYAAIGQRIDRLLKTRPTRPSAAGRTRQQREVRQLRDRFNTVVQTDFFTAATRDDVASSLARLEQVTSGRSTDKRVAVPSPHLSRRAFRRRRWVTRPRPGVDRMASAWFIRRFIDPKATFAFVDQPRKNDVPFDMYSGEFSHQGNACTFEVMLQRFTIDDPAAIRLGQIVHDLDMKETKYASPEGPVVGRMVEGLRAMHADDRELLEHGMGMFEALARSF